MFKNFKNKISYLLIGLLIGCLFPIQSLFADQPIKLIINGQQIQCDVPPQNINGRVMVPARFVAENLGATVDWDGENRAVVINSGENKPTNLVKISSVDFRNKDYTSQINIECSDYAICNLTNEDYQKLQSFNSFEKIQGAKKVLLDTLNKIEKEYGYEAKDNYWQKMEHDKYYILFKCNGEELFKFNDRDIFY